MLSDAVALPTPLLGAIVWRSPGWVSGAANGPVIIIINGIVMVVVSQNRMEMVFENGHGNEA